MKTTDTNAAQHAEPVQERLHLSALNQLDKTEYDVVRDEYGEIETTERPNLNVCATLSHESEDYVRIIKTLQDIKDVYFNALRGTYYDKDKAQQRYAAVLPLFNALRDEIGRDMGLCMADRLSEWQDDYI